MIRIYNGGGASKIGPYITARRFQGAGFETQFINDQQIKKNGVPADTALLVFGALTVTGFKNALESDGMNAIKDYVHNGGHYLGICAGGYFGAETIDFRGFDVSTRMPYSKNADGLGFAKATAEGSLTKITKVPFTGMTDSAAIIQLETPEEELFQSAYWGGGQFIIDENNKENIRILSRLQTGDASYTMGIQSDVGNLGGKATLLGYHPEIGENDLEQWIRPSENISTHTKRLFAQASAGTPDNNINMAFDVLLKQIGIKNEVVEKPTRNIVRELAGEFGGEFSKRPLTVVGGNGFEPLTPSV